MFSAPGLIFGSKVVGFRFHILRVRTHFRRYRGRRVRFACFAFPDSYSAVPRASTPVFMFCVPKHFFNGVEGVGSYFHVLKSRTHFRRFRQRLVPFSCFALPDSFLAVPRTSAPVFMLYAPGVVFGGIEGVESHFHVLRSRTRFRRYRGRRVPFSCFKHPNSFSAVPSVSGPVFMFCAPELIFDGTEGVGSGFHVLLSRTHFRWYRGRQVPHVLGARIRFRWFRGRRVPFSCFALPDSFSAVPTALVPVFMFCVPGHIFGSTEGVGSRFHVLRSRTRLRRCRLRRVSFS
jgi:hypothetical protein